MIQSDRYTYEQTRKFIFPVGITLLIIGILSLILFIINNRLSFIPFIFIALGLIYIMLKRKIDVYYKMVKISRNKINYYDDQNNNEILWQEVQMIGRIPFSTDYVLKTNTKTIIFPTSNQYGSISISLLLFLFIWDFSEMGKFIKEIRKGKNISSPLQYYLSK